MQVHLTTNEIWVMVQASWHNPTGSHQTIMHKCVDLWYHMLRDMDRLALYGWASRFLELDPDAGSVCGHTQRIWMGRFSPEAQYIAQKEGRSLRCFRVGDRYYTGSVMMIAQDADITFTPYEPKAHLPHYHEAKDLVITGRKASLQLLQRTFKIGTFPAQRLLDQLQVEGILDQHNNILIRR